MKVCFVVSVYPRSEHDLEVPWMREAVRQLRDQGVDVRIFAPSFRGLRSHFIDGCPVKRFRYFFSSLETLTHDEGAPNKIHKLHYKLITLFYLFFGTISLIRFHLKEKFDIIHVHWPAPHALFAYIANKFRPTKTLLTFYTADLKIVDRFAFTKPILRFFIRKADDVIAISSFSADCVKKIYNRDVHIIPYGTPIKAHAVKVSALNCKILSIGRMIERKGFEFCIRAMSTIRKKWPNASLTIAGGGPLQQELISLAEKLGLSDCVSLPGKVSDETLKNLIADCSVFVLPSIIDSKGDTEGLGVVLIEAMLYHKPVIATNIGGIVDIVIDKKTGLLVPQRDPEAIASAVNELFSDYPSALRMAEDGFIHVQNNFSWPVVIDKFKKVYNDTLAAK